MIATADRAWNGLHELTHLLVFLTLLNVADFCLTTYLVSHHGFDVENNLFLRSLMYATGTVYVILYAKGIALGSLWALIHNLPSHHKWKTNGTMRSTLRILNILFVGIVVWSGGLALLTLV